MITGTPQDFVSPSRRNLFVWFLLAFQAGAVNAGGFFACNRFVTHTTGFATHFGFELAHRRLAQAFGMLSVPAFFLLGAMVTSYFVDLPLHEKKAPNFKVPAMLIFVCLALATVLGELGAFGIFGDEMLNRDYSLLVLLCLASGLQNALITNSAGTVVRTTHLTGVTTDLASSLVRLLFGTVRDPERARRSFARFGIIASFVLGSAACAFLFLKAKYLGFLVPTCTSLVMVKFFVLKT